MSELDDHNPDARPWHVMGLDEVLERTGVSPESGLGEEEAERRLSEYGPNTLGPPKAISRWELLLSQFKNVLIVMLLIATIFSAFLGHTVEAIAIVVIVAFAVLFGFVQEYRAGVAIEALRSMASPSATVWREGNEKVIPAAEVVPGDVVVLRMGDQIPADGRVVEAVNLQLDESVLTGESQSVEKAIAALEDEHLALGDRTDMVYAGTVVSYGRGRAVVVATGRRTEFGRIAELLETVEPGRTPLQESLDRIGKVLARAALLIVAAIVILGLVRGQSFTEMLIFGIALAVAAVPEALPAVVTISLAIGVKTMAKRNALVRHLSAVETLGCTTIICADKTGTLTRDEMTVRTIWCGGRRFEVSGAGYLPEGGFLENGEAIEPPPLLLELLRAAALSSDATLSTRAGAEDAHGSIRGDPTEGALVVAAAKAGLDKNGMERRFPRVDEIPFTSEAKRMTTLHEGPDGRIAYAKGAPEVIVEACERRLTVEGESGLSSVEKRAALDVAQEMAAGAQRVIAIAQKKDATLDAAEGGMTLLGLVGMIDPPREEAREAIRECRRASVKSVMITGDHPLTARAIAAELEMLDRDRVITGLELEAMSDAEFANVVEGIDVYARVSPEHKLRVVEALQKHGHIVAMTGDGINDAPALKKADIGVAMGVTGTDVAREAAAMVLTDDNFASIVAAVEEGRGIFDNIKKYLMYLLSSNLGEIGLVGVASLIGLPLPLTAVQILYVNLATDGLPALALSVDPPATDLMRRQPRSARRSIFTRPVIALTVTGGLVSTGVNVGLFSWALASGRSLDEAMTMTFVGLVLIQFFKAYNLRSDRSSILERPFGNRWLNLAILWELSLLGLIVYLPFLREAFTTYPLSTEDWAIIIMAAATVVPVLEVVKWMIRQGWLGPLE